ncbi:MAG: hypothetical protein ACRDIV_25085 [Ktedonobacteraceae bacterium]
MIEMMIKINAVFKRDENEQECFQVYAEPEPPVQEMLFLLNETFVKVHQFMEVGDKLTVTFHVERS